MKIPDCVFLGGVGATLPIVVIGLFLDDVLITNLGLGAVAVTVWVAIYIRDKAI